MTWKPENQTLYSDCFVEKFPWKVKLLPREACTLPYLRYAHSLLTHPLNPHSGAGHAALERTWAEGTPIISALGTGTQEDQKAKVLWYRPSLRPPTSLVTVSQRHPWAALQSLYVWFLCLDLPPSPFCLGHNSGYSWLHLSQILNSYRYLLLSLPRCLIGQSWSQENLRKPERTNPGLYWGNPVCIWLNRVTYVSVQTRDWASVKNSLVSYCAVSFVGFCCF